MKVPSYHTSPGSYHLSPGSYHTSPGSYHDMTSPVEDKDNMMLDMAVAADKSPFLCASKANSNLQRALNRFLVYHEREKKLVHRQFEQEQSFYRKRAARCSTAIHRKIKTPFNTIVEDPQEEDDLDGKWAITKKTNMLSSPFTKTRPKTAGEVSNRLKIKTPPDIDNDTMEMTYTFNSLFGEVQQHVVPSATSLSSSGSIVDEDPLAGSIQQRPTITIKRMGVDSALEAEDTVSPITTSPGSKHTLRRIASLEAYNDLESRRNSSGESSASRQCSSAPTSPTEAGYTAARDQYVSENLFGNLSLEMRNDSRFDKIKMSNDRAGASSCGRRSRRQSVSETLRQVESQLGRSKRYEIRRESICSRRSSISSSVDFYSHPSNSTLTYSNQDREEPGMAVSKAITFLDRLDKYGSKRSKCHRSLVETVANRTPSLIKKNICPS